jgi:hypothetical protein
MDDHQRRLFTQMLEQLDLYNAGSVNLDRLVNNLGGLLGAADLADPAVIDAFYKALAPIDKQAELLTQPWAPRSSFSPAALETALDRCRAWIQNMHADPTGERL